jgi:APA family basic amino acid/polyamine antiporter
MTRWMTRGAASEWYRLPVSERRRDAGLVRVVGAGALAASIVNVVIGGGIFAVPSALAACAGARAPLVFLVCALAVGAVAVCFAEGGSRVPTSGGPYGTIEAGLGPFAAYVAGTLHWVSNVLACGGIAAALADAAVTLVSPAMRGPLHAAVVVVVVGGLALVNVGGITRAGRLVSITAVLKLLPIVVFVGVGATAVSAARLAEAAPPSAAGLGRALILALFTFAGMETALCASGEVARPSRTIPRALAMAMISLTLLFVDIQVVAQGTLGASLAASTAPLADAMARIHPALRVLILFGAATSMFGYVAADLLGTPRLMFALARDGWLPRALAVLHPRTRAPHVAILGYAALAIVLALTGTFAELAVLAGLSLAPIYVGGCAAAWMLARRNVALAGAPLGFRWIGVAALVGITSMVAMVALASRAEIAGLLAVVAVCGITYAPLARRAARLRGPAGEAS